MQNDHQLFQVMNGGVSFLNISDIRNFFLLILLAFLGNLNLIYSQTDQPIVGEDLIFEEKQGWLLVEAEHFFSQTKNSIRSWHRHSKLEAPKIPVDPDGSHLMGASNNAYLELLPDNRTTHGDELINELNFSNSPGKLAIINYKVYFNNPGKYYVWVRAYSTGSEDNGLHVGLDGEWPKSGQRMQWCKGKNAWTWESKQRTQKEHCGVPQQIYLEIKNPGIHEIAFSMREDGFEFDQFLLTNDINFKPSPDNLPKVKVRSGSKPAPFPVVQIIEEKKAGIFQTILSFKQGVKLMRALNFPIDQTSYYQNQQWLAINPNKAKEASASNKFPFASNTYDIVFLGVGENDGQSTYNVSINGKEVGAFTTPLSKSSFEEGYKYLDLWENIAIEKGDQITVHAKIGSKDGQEYSRARWGGIAFVPTTKGKDLLEHMKGFSSAQNVGERVVISNNNTKKPPEYDELEGTNLSFSDPAIRQENGSGKVIISGELKQWHKVTLSLDGPYAHELDREPNPFTDYKMTVIFTHESGDPSYAVPGYFAADGNASETSADNGNVWRAHLAPDKSGTWNYEVQFHKGEYVAMMDVPWASVYNPYHGKKGRFEVSPTDKSGRDFRGKGRLEYVGKHYLQFRGTKEFFFKAGADAPETLLAYEDFDGTYTKKTPLKNWSNHIKDWQNGDPVWKEDKGKGLIGAINYLANKGVNSFSFLTYNAGGDGYNVWPFVQHDKKYNYDCSKLDQWQILFDHAQSKGMYLHFKLQETENDDNKKGKAKEVVEALDDGDLGPQRRLYIREMMARFGYNLALNWNLGEENTQSTQQRRDMAAYIDQMDPYPHNIVIHTFPKQQDAVYPALLGEQSNITGASLQNVWNQVHRKTLHWIKASDLVGKPWVVANDEQGSAAQGVPPDPDYNGYDENTISYNIHDIRKQTLWANLMAGGAGVEYYFGYKLPENDLVCEDFRSRDQSWDFCKIAIDFFQNSGLPFWEMHNRNDLIGNPENEKEKFCLAKEGEVYLIYLAYASTAKLNLHNQEGEFEISWFNPRNGIGDLKGSQESVQGGGNVSIGNPPSDEKEDWLVILRRN